MKVKIELEPNENIDEANELLVKAITQHAEGASHSSDFADPAARDLVSRLNEKFEKMMRAMLRDINKVIDEGVK